MTGTLSQSFGHVGTQSVLRQERRSPITTTVESLMPLSGGDLAYTSAGTGSEVLVLIHGLGGSRQTWRHLIPSLARTHTVIALDLPGHGESDPPAGDYSLGAHACAVRDLMLALGHQRATLIGHSLGGGVAMQAAYQFPERIDRLVLISSGGMGTEVSPILRAATLPGAETVVAGLSRIPTAVTRGVLTVMPPLAAASDASTLARALRGLASNRRRRAFVRTAHAVIDWHGQTVSASQQLGLLRDVPVLVVWGNKDTTIPPHHHQAFAEGVPHTVMVEIPDAGHFPHETASVHLLVAVKAFLATTKPFDYTVARWTDLLTQNRTHGARFGSSVADHLRGAIGTRRIIDAAIGALMELRRCSEREAVRELVLAGRHTGRDTAAIARALMSLVAGHDGDDGDADHVVVQNRWGHLLDTRERLNSAPRHDPVKMTKDVVIRHGGVDDYTRC